MKRILVTGSSGFIGSEVVALAGNDQFIHYDLKLGKDIRDSLMFARYINDLRPDGVIHLAALKSVPESNHPAAWADYFSTNVDGTFNVMEICSKQYNIPVFFISSSACDRPPYCWYGTTKLMGEQMCNYFKNSYVRLKNIYGGQSSTSLIDLLIRSRMTKKPVIITEKGEQIRTWQYVGDTAKEILRRSYSSMFGHSWDSPYHEGYTCSVNHIIRTMIDMGKPPIFAYEDGSTIVPDRDLSYVHEDPPYSRLWFGIKQAFDANGGV